MVDQTDLTKHDVFDLYLTWGPVDQIKVQKQGINLLRIKHGWVFVGFNINRI